MKYRHILSSSLLLAGLASASLSFATPLTIVNNTNNDSTSIINGGKCSSWLPGGYGITKAHSSKSIPDMIIGMACIGHSASCSADIYMTNNCSGPKVGTAVLNTKTGIISISNESNHYTISGSGFTIQADPK